MNNHNIRKDGQIPSSKLNNQKSNDAIHLQEKLLQNQNKNQLNAHSVKEEPTEEVTKESKGKQVAQEIGKKAISAATGLPEPAVEAITQLHQKAQSKSIFAKILLFFGLPPEIAYNPFLRGLIFSSIPAIFLFLFLIGLLGGGRIEDGRPAINSYLSTGSIEEDGDDLTLIDQIRNEFIGHAIYDYLLLNGWCEEGENCYESDAALFFRTFRKKIKRVEILNSASNESNRCDTVGFVNDIKLDVPMLTATFTYYRADDEFLSARDGESYDDKLKIFSDEIDGLTNAMVYRAKDIVANIKVTTKNNKGERKIQTISVTNESTCTQYGFDWITTSVNSNGGYCIAKEGQNIADNVIVAEQIPMCHYVSEDNYHDYIVGDGDFYATPGTYTPIDSENQGTPKQSVLDYIDSISAWASEDMSQSGIYASVTIAQGILESGSGRSGLTVRFNNHFGMKGKGGSCSASQAGTTKKDSSGNNAWDGTSACMCGRDGCYWYRAYQNVGESLADHSRNFWVTKSYGKNGVLECVQNNLGPEEQITRIKKAGYAEDEEYVSKIMNLIRTYDLTQYDTGIFEGEPPIYNSGISSGDHAPNRYTSGGYLELFRMSLLENKIDLITSKEEAYSEILAEAQETGSSFGKDNNGSWFESNIVDLTGGDYTRWKQGDPAWKNIPIGTGTIGGIGCAATSVAIQIARSRTFVTIENFNPGTFVQAMSRIGGFQGNLIVWDKANKIAPFFQYDGNIQRRIKGLSKSQKLSYMRDLIQSGCYLIMSVKSGGHWVAVTGVTNDNVHIIDPGANVSTALPFYRIDGVTDLRCYRKLD